MEKAAFSTVSFACWMSTESCYGDPFDQKFPLNHPNTYMKTEMWFGDPGPSSRGRRFHLSLVTHSWSCVGPAGREARPLGQVPLPGEVLHSRAHAVPSGDPKSGAGKSDALFPRLIPGLRSSGQTSLFGDNPPPPTAAAKAAMSGWVQVVHLGADLKRQEGRGL